MTLNCLLLADADFHPTSIRELAESPVVRLIFAVAFLVIGLWWLLPGPQHRSRGGGIVFSFLGIGSIWTLVPLIKTASIQWAFWISAGIAIAASLATITSRKPIYSAIWFAVSLLGVAGLFLLQGAQFLGIATVAVYAGAIVVTLLFVLMLAQPEGYSHYDRISWGNWPRIMVPLFAMLTVGLIAHSLGDVNRSHVQLHDVVREFLRDMEADDRNRFRLDAIRVKNANKVVALTISVSGGSDESRTALKNRKVDLQQEIAKIDRYAPNVIRIHFANSVAARQHVANLGGRLFTLQLVSVQVAGCLLLVALVGAIVIASHPRANERMASSGVAE